MINYVVLVNQEQEEFVHLIKHLKYSGVELSKIIVVRDTAGASEDDEISKVIKQYKLTSYIHPLNNDFAQQRNYANSLCQEAYIMHIDADEAISYKLLQELPKILESNPQVDILGVPRLNYLENDTEMNDEDIPEWVTPKPDNLSRIAWPDVQWRVMRNSPYIKWEGKVHEVPKGGQAAVLPLIPSMCIVHCKKVSGQIKRQELYEKITSRML